MEITLLPGREQDWHSGTPHMGRVLGCFSLGWRLAGPETDFLSLLAWLYCCALASYFLPFLWFVTWVLDICNCIS